MYRVCTEKKFEREKKKTYIKIEERNKKTQSYAINLITSRHL